MTATIEVPAVPQDGIVRSGRSSLASLLAILRDPLAALPRETFEQRMTTADLFGRQRIHITDPALIHEAFVRNADALDKTELSQRILGPALGRGLLTTDGAHWRHQRRAIAPIFQHERLLALLPAMIAAAEATRDRWRAAGASGAPIDLGDAMMRTTFAIIAETMLSGPGEIDADRVQRAITDYLGPTPWLLALGLLGAPEWVPFPGRRLFRQSAGALRSIVAAKVAERRAAGRGSDDLVQLLLRAADPETGEGMTDEEITDNILTFVTAGHETTANALTWTLRLLAGHPEPADAVVRELDAIVGDGSVQPHHIAQLAYTRQVLNEAMRLYPPAPMIVRKALHPFDLGGMSVAKDTIVIAPIYALHRNTRLWLDPETFRPERFAPEAVRLRHRQAFMPFGAGPRICIGSAFAVMEAVAVLAVLLQSVRLEALDPAMPTPAMRVTLRPKEPVMMRVLPRPEAHGRAQGLLHPAGEG